jgi:DNA primase
VLLFDGDAAGLRAIEKALLLLLPEGLRVSAVALPSGDDPDSYLAREGDAALRALIDSAEPALEGVIRRAAAGGHETAWKAADAVAKVAPMLALISDKVEQVNFTQQLAMAVGTEARHVEAAIFAQRRGQDPRDAVPERPRKRGPEDRIVAQLVRSLVECPELAERISTEELLDLLPEGPASEIVRVILARPASKVLDLEALCEDLSGEAQGLLRELAAANTALDLDTATQVLVDTTRWLKKRQATQEAQALTQQLRDGDKDWRDVLAEKQRRQDQPKFQGNQRVGIFT